MTDPLKALEELEERVKKAEASIPELTKEVQRVSSEYAKAMDRNEHLNAKLKKYEELASIVKDVFGLASRDSLLPSPSTGAIGSQDVEVKDPSQIIEVQDFQEPLQVSTISLRGQVAKLILEGKLGASLVNAKAVRHLLISEFGPGGEQWDIDTVLKELKALTAPPFRLFTFNPKNYMFRLRTGSEKRVKE